jgi:hypothetical protein
VASVVPAVDEGAVMALSSVTEAELPRWMACRSIIENQTSTRFIREA